MNYHIARRAAALTPSITLAVDSKAKQMKAEGIDVVGFGAGEPDFQTPKHIIQAAIDALNAGFTKYTPSSGIPELRQAAADKFKRDNGLTYKPSQIIISCGGKHSCCNVILAVCDPGDEVIIPAPYWLSYPEMARLAEARPVIVETSDKTDFKVTPAQLRAASRRARACSSSIPPATPPARSIRREEIKALGDICVENGVLIMSDEIYEKLVYDGAEHASVAAFSPRHYEHTILVHGLAKAYSMTGWRIGLTAAPEPIAKAIDAIQSHSTSNPTSFAQKGAVAALNGPQDHLPVWLAEFARAPRLCLEKAQQHPRHLLRQCQGRLLSFPEHFRHGPKVDGVLRAIARPAKGRGCSWHRFRRGRLHPPQLRHQHGEH